VSPNVIKLSSLISSLLLIRLVLPHSPKFMNQPWHSTGISEAQDDASFISDAPRTVEGDSLKDLLLGDIPSRNVAVVRFTRPCFASFPKLVRAGASGREMIKGGAERHGQRRHVSCRPLVSATLLQIQKQVALPHVLLIRQECAAPFGT
jgi:hypothetical protein